MRKPSSTAERVFSSFSQTAQARRLGFSMLLIFASALACQAQVVSQRTRLGNATEDITFVSSGRFANHIAIVDGYEVLGVPLEGCVTCTTGKLLDLHGLGTRVAPRGITFIQSEELFAFNDPWQVTTLFLTDDQGQPRASRTIKYMGGFTPAHVEGLAYIPANAAQFPDHLIEVALTPSFLESRLEILRRDAEVVAEIVSQQPVRSKFLLGVAFAPPDRILVSTDEGEIWTLDFAGNILAGPVVVPSGAIEGLEQLPDGRIVATGVRTGAATLLFFDGNLNRLPEQDQGYTVGFGLVGLEGVAWNSDTAEHLIVHGYGPPEPVALASIPPLLDASTEVVDLLTNGFGYPQQVTFMPDEHLIAVAHRVAPSAILLFNSDGVLVEQINLSAALGNPRAISYIPITKQFAVLFTASSQLLKILSRTGELVRTIDLSLKGIGSVSALAFFNPTDPSGGNFLLFEGSSRLVETYRACVTDFSGNVLSQFNYRDKLGVLAVTAAAEITSGPDIGSFSIIDSSNSEIVIFSLQ